MSRIADKRVILGPEEPTAVTSSHGNDTITLGRYELCFEVASGGMATVYLARIKGPKDFGKIVALKRVHRHLARQLSFVEMFQDEARIASRINHPNVCGVMDFGEADNTYFLTMEYLIGEPLSVVIKTAAHYKGSSTLVPFDCFAAKIIADACEGLHAAHELRDSKGEPLHIVHRDISPGNLFVTYDGNVKVVDFGVARAADCVHRTSTGEVKGKFGYMSPEQMVGSEVDRRSDVWSLGVTLYEMLAFKRLFERGNIPSTMKAVQEDEVPRISKTRQGVSTELDKIIDRSLQRDPTNRYQTARELGKDLNNYLASRNQAIGMAEVAEWMHALCPDGLATKQQLIQLAEQPGSSVPHAYSIPQEELDSKVVTNAINSVSNESVHGEKNTLRFPILLLVLLSTLGILSSLLFVYTKYHESGFELPTWIGYKHIKQHSIGLHQQSQQKVNTHSLSKNYKSLEKRQYLINPLAENSIAKDKKPRTRTEENQSSNSDKSYSRYAPEKTIASRGTGYVSLATPGGWATVYHRGKKLGTTPGRFEVPVGKQHLRLYPFGGTESIGITVQVLRDEVVKATESIEQ